MKYKEARNWPGEELDERSKDRTFQLISWRQIGRLQVTDTSSLIEVGHKERKSRKRQARWPHSAASDRSLAVANSRATIFRYNDWKLPLRVTAWRLSIWKFHGLPWKSLNLFRNWAQRLWESIDPSFLFHRSFARIVSLFTSKREEWFRSHSSHSWKRVSLPLTLDRQGDS